MKTFYVICKVALSLLLIMPILGALGIFPAPTADMYSNPEAFAFISALYAGGYIIYINAVVFAIALVCLWRGRAGLAALLILPITINIVAFHAFLDGGLLTGGALMGNLMLLLNIYFLYQHRAQYRPLFERAS